jgi:hypothetical protein
MLLSLAWRLDPKFPHNLPVAAWISWLTFPATLLMLAVYTPRLGIAGWRGWALIVLFAVNPYVVWFSAQLLSELLFMALLFAAFLLIERASEETAGPAVAAVAGVTGGLAYLARSAGIVLIAAGFVYLWTVHKRRANAWIFAVAMLPFIVGWTAWSRIHMLYTADPALVYYTDYFGYELYNVNLSNFHLFLWKNVDGLLLGLGSLVLPKVTGSLFLKILAQVIAVAMISGVVRLVRRGDAWLYTMFAAGTAVMLLAWHFPPDERFVLPLFPLGLAGLIVELGHFFALLRTGLGHRDVGQRVVAAGLMCVAILIFGGALALQAYVGAVLQPESAHGARLKKVDEIAAYGWITVKTPEGAPLLAYADPVLYLYTGRPVLRRPLLPKLWYQEDQAGVIDLWGNLKSFAQEHGLKYYYVADGDLAAATDEERAAIEQAHRLSTDMTSVYRKGAVTIYEFGP